MRWAAGLVILLSVFGVSSKDAFSMGAGIAKDQGIEEVPPAYDQNLMPQPHKDYVFDTQILMDVRSEAMARTRMLMASFENKEAQVGAARLQLGQMIQEQQNTIQEK